MRLFKYTKLDDWGIDRYIILLSMNGWSFFQSCLSTTIFGRNFPNFTIIIGSGRLFYFSFSMWKIGITLEFLGRTWRFYD